MKKKEILKTIITIIVSVVLSSGISVYATSTYLYDSCDVSYDNTSSGLNSSNVQSSLDELYMHATDYTSMDTRVSSLEGHFLNNSASYFDSNWLNIKSSDSLERGIGIYDSNNNNRSNFFYAPSTDITYLDARDSNGTFGQGTLNLRGNPVMINGSEVAKKPVQISISERKNLPTTFSYSGTSVTIPANSFFVITARALFAQSKPVLIGISTSSSQFSEISSNATGRFNATTSYSGKTEGSSLTLYIWVNYENAGSNTINITGFYIPY